MAAAKQLLFISNIFAIFTLFSHVICDECGVANIYITNDDGSEKIFTIKHVNTQLTDESGQSSTPHCPSGTSASSGSTSAGSESGATSGSGSGIPASQSSQRKQSRQARGASTTGFAKGEDVQLLSPRIAAPTLGDLISDFNRDAGPAHSQHPMPISGAFVWNAFSLCDKLPRGEYLLCRDVYNQKGSNSVDMEKVKQFASILSENKLLPIGANDIALEKEIAQGLVLLSLGLVEASAKHFAQILSKSPNIIGAYYCRGLAHVHRGQQSSLELALKDFTTALEMNQTSVEIRESKAQVLMMLNRLEEAKQEVEFILSTDQRELSLLIRGTYSLMTNNLLRAERDLRKAAQVEGIHSTIALYNLAVTLFYRGRIHNAVEVLRDVIRRNSDHFESHLALSYCYRELNDFRRFKLSINKSLELQPLSLKALQLYASTLYRYAHFDQAKDNILKCLSIDPSNMVCLYLKGLIETASGHIYSGILSHTKATVYASSQPQMLLTPEFIQAHYLREYSHYLHQRLDQSIHLFDLDSDLSLRFRANWVRQSAYIVQDLDTLPGLQPQISDVEPVTFESLSPKTQSLLCYAKRTGDLTEFTVDGQMSRPRVNLALGLAAVHVAQLFQKLWKEELMPDFKNIHIEIMQLIGKYLQLADPELPVIFADRIPGHWTEFNFIWGHSINPRLNPYFELVFKLIKTMLYHRTDAVYTKLKNDVQHIYTADDLLKILKKSSLPDQTNGLSIFLQVQSRDDPLIRLEGGFITLAMEEENHMLFSLRLPANSERSKSFNHEISLIYSELFSDIQQRGKKTNAQTDERLFSKMLTLVYYIYNWSPFNRNSGLIAYTLAIGLVMSVGKEVTGRVPNGKIMDLEGILSGTPDAFILVTQPWMNIQEGDEKRSLSSLPMVAEALPTVRSILEALNSVHLECGA